VIDIQERRLEVEVPRGELDSRLRGWKRPPPRYKTGVFAKYAALVSSASEGAVTRVPTEE
jgi:dihydroxy-acid dehydratase